MNAGAGVVLLLAALAAALDVQAESLGDIEFRQATHVPADRAAGARLYRSCATCHGESGAGSSGDYVPRIAGQHFRVLVRQLVDYRHGGRWNDRMQAATSEHRLADAQAVADVATYVNLMRITGPASLGTGLAVEEGVRIYDALCRSCHGASARGSDARLVPRLAGQNYGYLVRQFDDIAQGKRANAPRAHQKMLAKLGYQEIVALSDYLSQLML